MGPAQGQRAEEVSLSDLTAILSRVGRDHPDLIADEKVRRYINLVVEEGKKLPAEKETIAPVDCSEI